MALVKRRVLGKIEVLEDGQIQLREDTLIEEDGVELYRVYHRRVLEPSLTPVPVTEPLRLQQVASVVWTPQVVADFEERKRARQTPGIPANPPNRV